MKPIIYKNSRNTMSKCKRPEPKEKKRILTIYLYLTRKKTMIGFAVKNKQHTNNNNGSQLFD